MTSQCHCGTAMMQQSNTGPTAPSVWHQSTSQHHQHHQSHHSAWLSDGTTMVLPECYGKAPTQPGACRMARKHSMQPKDQGKLDGRCSAVTSIETNRGDPLQGSARTGALLPPHRCSSAAGAPTNTPLNQPPALLDRKSVV